MYYVVKRKSAYDREEMRERTLENNGSPSVDLIVRISDHFSSEKDLRVYIVHIEPNRACNYCKRPVFSVI